MAHNPITSVAAAFMGARQGPQHHKLYEALCMEEAGETLVAFNVTDGISLDETNKPLGQTLQELAKILRSVPNLSLHVEDQAELLDAHLDSAWVHLGAALAMLGGSADALQRAWDELHRSNIADKQVDGNFVLDPSGKIVKPADWTKPDFNQFFTTTTA